METDAAVLPLSHKINVLAVIDTEYIKHNYSSGDNPLSPTPVESENIFLIGVNPDFEAGELNIRARIGDIIYLTGTSADHNSTDAALIYNVHPRGPKRVFASFKQRFMTRQHAVQPDPDSASRDGLPALETIARFSDFESRVRAHGAELIHIDFALYVPSESGQRQELFGYYRCELNATVERARP
ncbi:AidA/PixA family protein [Paraburkholderia xenovorans]|uniref:AidA/PixA family protein n=1 Tax=Paraburkholderia xenovorans TaxID=36873 RepID=UPI0038BB4CB3